MLYLDYNSRVEENVVSIKFSSFTGDRDILLHYLKTYPSAQALLDLPDSRGLTPLHIAASRGHDACCGLLLDFGADLQAKSKKGEKTPLQLAEKSSNEDTAYYLHVRWTSSRKAGWTERLQNPPFLFTLAILGAVTWENRKLCWDFFWDVVDPLKIEGNVAVPLIVTG